MNVLKGRERIQREDRQKQTYLQDTQDRLVSGTLALKTGWSAFSAANKRMFLAAVSASSPSAKTSNKASRASPFTTRSASLVATWSKAFPIICGSGGSLEEEEILQKEKRQQMYLKGFCSALLFG